MCKSLKWKLIIARWSIWKSTIYMSDRKFRTSELCYFKIHCFIWNSVKYRNSSFASFEISLVWKKFKSFIGYCCGSSWKAQWEKRKLWWFYNYWPMGNNYSSTSRHGFSFCYCLKLGFFCLRFWRLYWIVWAPCSLTIKRTFLLNSSNICYFEMLFLENRFVHSVMFFF